MDKDDTKNEERSDYAVPDPTHTDTDTDPVIALDKLTEKWKRALADAENARKRADLARLDGHDHGIFNWHYLRMLCPCEVCRGKA